MVSAGQAGSRFTTILKGISMSVPSKDSFFTSLQNSLDTLREQGLYKPERVLASRQGAEVTGADGRHLINMCANNYLGLAGDLQTQQASIEATEKYGYGLSSVRFICGTQTVHKELERALADFLGMEDTILYAAAFDANGGLFEPLFDENDAIASSPVCRPVSTPCANRACTSRNACWPRARARK